mmetsp:Transcript_13766/g.23439  ORF Transcript_13766/g.23439 Transcript_13766/m.23439 type:complete len:265 (-) Transcript_13766:746-1540(-)|eukprot:CAMPEP_0116542548 /NCGR_PEP_ID=MMETSP0397-20121206/1075_1 /TAXON_ID=216820 /ORGANISM="Cyclophora tenuis, Strain ECT3854" /LENGTH=264 /DNA_ID=CAMNT_0004066565 /DNA_START=34 /DNA_END=828 /DNA_ORIENTATION=-
MSNSLKKAGESVAKQALKVPRAVTAKEAPMIQPATESTTESMMPWRGWDKLSSYLKEKLGEERYAALHKFVTYRPGDIHEMHQIPNPSTKVPISKDDPNLTAQFRYPSPGSQPPVRMPKAEPGSTREDPYNVTYYTRDTGRRGLDPANPFPELQKIKLELMDPNSPEVQEMKEALEPQSSPGNQGNFATGPTDYDPTGLRASMSANHAALEESLDANMPDHLPYPDWYDKQEEVVAWYKERDLQVPFGATGYGTVPTERRVARS